MVSIISSIIFFINSPMVFIVTVYLEYGNVEILRIINHKFRFEVFIIIVNNCRTRIQWWFTITVLSIVIGIWTFTIACFIVTYIVTNKIIIYQIDKYIIIVNTIIAILLKCQDITLWSIISAYCIIFFFLSSLNMF